MLTIHIFIDFTGPKLHKNKPGIEHLPMQDNANPIEESEHNKYQYQLFNNDFATGIHAALLLFKKYH